MPVNDLQRDVVIDRESSFADISTKDWTSLTANGGRVYLTSIDVTGFKQGTVENENIKTRPGASWAPILALKNIELSAEAYFWASTTHAASGSQATAAVRDEFLYNATGTLNLGYACEGAGSGTAAAPEIDPDDMDSASDYGWLFNYDTSEATGLFVRYDDVTDGGTEDTLNLSSGHECVGGAVPADGDPFHAVVWFNMHWDAMEDHTHGSHISSTMLVSGRHTEDTYEAKGVKFGLGQVTIEAGSAVKLTMPGRAATFTDTEDITKPSISGTIEGRPGYVAGRGASTKVLIADTGSVLATQQFEQSIVINIGIDRDPVMGPNGREGVHGYGITPESYDSQTIEMEVPFNDDWIDDFRTQQRKHILIQVGDQPDDAIFFYAQNAVLNEEPEKVTTNGRANLKLVFKLLEGTGTLTGTAATDDRLRAKLEFGYCA